MDTHSSPPGTSSPPEGTEPDTGRLHLAERTLDSGDTVGVGASTDLTEETPAMK